MSTACWVVKDHGRYSIEDAEPYAAPHRFVTGPFDGHAEAIMFIYECLENDRDALDEQVTLWGAE